jgi:hypothetical protein
MEDHLRECIGGVIKEEDAQESEAAIREMVTVLGRALRQ